MVNPDDYPAGTAEAKLAEFVLLWKKRKWSDLVDQCQITWAKEYQAKAEGLLRLQFGTYHLLDARLGETVSVTDVTKDIPITIDYKAGKGVAHKTLLARVICESAPFTPDVAGQWGVNPTSLMRVNLES